MKRSITYQDKQAIAQYIADPNRWRNTFDIDAIRSPSDPEPDEPESDEDKPLIFTRLFHRISFDTDAWAHLSPFTFMDGLKLTVAHDFGVEPSLRSFNYFDDGLAKPILAAKKKEHGPHGFVGNLFNPAPPPITDAEKPWDDVVEFDGYVDIGWRAQLEKTDDGFDLVTDLDGREQILSVGTVLEKTSDHSLPSENYNHRAISIKPVLDFLKTAPEVKNHRGEIWKVFRLHSEKAGKLARKLRALGLRGSFCAAVNDQKASVLVTANLEHFEASPAI